MSEKTYYHYRCALDSALGRKLARLTERYTECMHAADALALKIGAKEFTTDVRYMAGGVDEFIFDHKPRAKKLLAVVREKDGEFFCVPNPNANRGLKLACRMARLPHVTYDEYCEVFGFDRNDPQYKGHSMPMFFTVGEEWAYIRSTFSLMDFYLSCCLEICTEDVFEEALKYVTEE